MVYVVAMMDHNKQRKVRNKEKIKNNCGHLPTTHRYLCHTESPPAQMVTTHGCVMPHSSVPHRMWPWVLALHDKIISKGPLRCSGRWLLCAGGIMLQNNTAAPRCSFFQSFALRELCSLRKKHALFKRPSVWHCTNATRGLKIFAQKDLPSYPKQWIIWNLI
jgi:hypothetical protein